MAAGANCALSRSAALYSASASLARPRWARKVPRLERASGRSALSRCAATNSAAARSKRSRSAADAAIGIGEERRDQRPELAGRHVGEHVERADAYHGIGI